MKSKHSLIIYSIIFTFIISITIPTISICFNENDIYKWSTIPSVQTSITPTIQEQDEEKNKENSRQFFRYYIWKLYINGSKNWSSSI